MKLITFERNSESLRLFFLGFPIFYRKYDQSEIRTRFLCFHFKTKHSKLDNKIVENELKNIIQPVVASKTPKHKRIKNTKPDVSVIVPVFNAANYLNQCIDSLKNQDDKNIEFIIIDDCSTDNSLNVIRGLINESDDRFKILSLKRNIGVAATRNIGISIAKGSYIGFVDPDDYISPNYYSSLYKQGRLNNSDIVVNRVIKRITDDGKFLGRKNAGVNSEGANVKLRDRMRMAVTTGVTWNKIYKSEFLKGNCILFPEIKTMGTDNYVTFLALMLANKVTVIEKGIYFYRENPKSIIRKKKDSTYFLLTDVYSRLINRAKFSDVGEKYKILWLKLAQDRFVKDTISNLSGFHDVELRESYIDYCHEVFSEVKFTSVQPIISLTSYPARIKTVDQTIRSLKSQNHNFKKIILWLAKSQFPRLEKDLPNDLLAELSDKFEIRWCEKDLRSYKKLIPALKEYPDDIIVTCDDDIIYPTDWLSRLVASYLAEPTAVHCLRGRVIKIEKGNVLPYAKWRLIDIPLFSSYNILLTGAGGCLYKREHFCDLIFDDKFMDICPDADDVWFWAMAVLNNTKIRVGSPTLNRLNEIENETDTSLWSKNKFRNDAIFKKVLETFPEIRNRIMEENV